MPRQLRTIRARLALMNLVVIGTILALLSAVLLQLRERDLLSDFDERLRDQAAAMVDSIELAADFNRQRYLRSDDRPRLNPFRFPGYYFQIRLRDGTLLEKSRNLQGVELPFGEGARQSATSGTPFLETTAVALPSAPAGQLRLLTLYHQPEGMTPFYLQVGRALDAVQQSISGLRHTILWIVPAGLIIAGLGSYLFARHALAPIREIVRAAKTLSATQLDQRLATPRGDDEVVELVRTLNDMLDRLDQAFNAQQRFIANASHELRTPIAVLLGEVSVLKQKARTLEEYDRFAGHVEDEIRGLAHLINGLLTLARASTGRPLAAVSSTSINDVITESVQRCQTLAQHREVRLVTNVVWPEDDQPDPVVLGDGQLLAAMVSNLIRNALRYSPVDKPVEIAASLDGRYITIAVGDYGPGIAPEHLPHVFDEFYHVPDGQSSYCGLGLGLAIARNVAELHGGDIQVCNRAQGGCLFTVRLPLHIAPPAGT